MLVHFGPKKRVCWWVPDGEPNGDTWLSCEARRLSFRMGIELGHAGPTDSFGHDHVEIFDYIIAKRPVGNKKLFRWWHRVLLHGGSLQLRFHWGGWRPWKRLDLYLLWDWSIDWVHLKLNPKGDGCTCWRDS